MVSFRIALSRLILQYLLWQSATSRCVTQNLWQVGVIAKLNRTKPMLEIYTNTNIQYVILMKVVDVHAGTGLNHVNCMLNQKPTFLTGTPISTQQNSHVRSL